MKKLNTALVAVVTRKPGSGKCYTATHIRIEAAGLLVAEATLGGAYNQAQALAEFRRNSSRFTVKGDGWPLWENKVAA